MAGVCYCYDCKKVLRRTKTVEEAQSDARLHMALTPHIMVFGYSAQAAKAKGLI